MGLAVGDFNGDGRPDLAVTNYGSGTLGILLANGNNSFAPVVTQSPGFGTVERRGRRPQRRRQARPGRGQRLLRRHRRLPRQWRRAVHPQFAAELRHHVALQHRGRRLQRRRTRRPGRLNPSRRQVLLNSGSGDGLPVRQQRARARPISRPAVADLDGNGQPDLVVANPNDNSVGVLELRASSPVALTSPDAYTFNVAVGEPAPANWSRASAASNPFNGDGRLVVGTLFAPKIMGMTQTDGNQSLVTGNGTAAGLTVSREVDRARQRRRRSCRTVNTFTNPTGLPITTTVQILGNLGSNAATTVFATSNGDTTVQPSDQWIGTDDTTDGAGTPAVIHYIHGPNGLQPASVSVVGDNIQWTYNLTVPAGQTVRLAYFTILGITRAEAIAAANTLVASGGFGGQAAEFLSTAELQSLVNFSSVVNAAPVLAAASPSWEPSRPTVRSRSPWRRSSTTARARPPRSSTAPRRGRRRNRAERRHGPGPGWTLRSTVGARSRRSEPFQPGAPVAARHRGAAIHAGLAVRSNRHDQLLCLGHDQRYGGGHGRYAVNGGDTAFSALTDTATLTVTAEPYTTPSVLGREILDDSQPGFWCSSYTTWTTGAGFDGTSLTSSTAAGSEQSMAAWWFSMPAGVYDLAVTYPAGRT